MNTWTEEQNAVESKRVALVQANEKRVEAIAAKLKVGSSYRPTFLVRPAITDDDGAGYFYQRRTS